MITGDIGTSTGTSLPVYAPYIAGTPGLDGEVHANDGTAIEARAAVIAALHDIKGRSDGQKVLGGVVELGGLTLGAGLYTSTTAMQRKCFRPSDITHPPTLTFDVKVS